MDRKAGGGGGCITVDRVSAYVYVFDNTYTYLRFSMKKKLTITIDAGVLPEAKRYARSRGLSLSSVIEDTLRVITEDMEPSFVDRWRGWFTAASHDDGRFRALADKYL